MKNCLLLSIVTVAQVSISTVFAQVKPDVSKVGGTNFDVANCIIQSKDGGYAITGETYSHGAEGEDVYVVKLNSAGNVKWTKTIGGKGNQYGYSILQTKDGGYSVIGETFADSAKGEDIYLVKLDSAGHLKWTKNVGGIGDQYGYSVVETYDGGYAITGETSAKSGGNEDIYLIKLDAEGALKWTRTITGQKHGHGYPVIQTKDGGYAIGEYQKDSSTYNNKHYTFSILKLDSAGHSQWTKTLGGGVGRSPYYIIQTKDGGYAITGVTYLFGQGNGDAYVIKLDAAGNLQWRKTVGGKGKDIGFSIIQSADGGYAVTGATNSSGVGNYDVYVMKLDTAGNTKWTKTLGEAGDDEGQSIIQTSDGGYAIGGFTNADKTSNYNFYAIKLDALGNVQWTKAIGDDKH